MKSNPARTRRPWWVLLIACLVFPTVAAAQTLIEQTVVTGVQSEMMAQQAGAAGNAQGQAQQAQQPAAAAPAPQSAAPATPGPAAEPAFLLSPIKPIIVFLLLLGWGWVVSNLDKDAAYFYLHRTWWNLAQMACGILGFAMMLLIPIFFVGLLLGLLILLGGILGYAYYRNTKVPAEAQWSLSLDSFRAKYEGARHRQAQKHATLQFLTRDESRLDVPSGEDPRAVAHATLEQVVEFAVPRGADQIQLAVDAQQAQMNARIDGVLYPQPPMDPKAAVVLIDYLKELAGLDMQDRRKRQHGTLRLDAGDLGRHTLEIETSGSTRGLQVVMNIDATQRKQMSLQHVGLLESQRTQLQSLLESRGGVIIISAPPGHGLTTSLYSFIAQHDPYTASIVTMEKEVTLELEGVSHNEMGELSPQQWNEKLSATIRSDPNVIMLDHLPDPETAPIIARAASEIRFYVGMQEEDTFAALTRWIKACGNKKLAGQSIGGITAQRLVRKLCATCRTPYKPDPSALRKLNLPVDRVHQLYHASGQVMDRDKAVPCPDCMGLGYKGRVAVFEVMALDDTARDLISAGNLDQLKSYLRKQRLMPLLLNEAGLAKVVEGLTDVKEITRGLGGGKSGGGGTTRSSSGGGGSAPSGARPKPAPTGGGAPATPAAG